MSQTNCECLKPVVRVPVRGLELALDEEALGGLGTGNCQCSLMPPADLYVATDGDDANDGLTPETAFASIQAAVDSTRRFKQTDFTVTIHVAPGTYEGGVRVDGAAGHYKHLAIQGQADARPLILGMVSQWYCGTLSAINLHVKSTSSCFRAHDNTSLEITDCAATVVNNHGGAICWAQSHASVYIYGNCAFTTEGSCGYFIVSNNQGLIIFMEQCNVTFNGAVIYTAFSSSNGGVIIVNPNVAFSGNVTGRKYYANYQGLIRCPITIPGSQAGVVSNGGGYYS